MTPPPEASAPRESEAGEEGITALHPVVVRAADGVLPEWARADEERREHMARVAAVLESWARALDLESGDVLRWRSLGFLHDALRDASVDELESVIQALTDTGNGERRAWRIDRHAFSLERHVREPGSVEDQPRDDERVGRAGLDEWAPVGGSLHGPAAAAFLARDGVEDEELLAAVAYHTVGHPDLEAAGRALYCADFVEPGRSSDRALRAELRSRYPGDPDGVLRDVLRSRIGYVLERGRPIFLGTARMWNRLNR